MTAPHGPTPSEPAATDPAATEPAAADTAATDPARASLLSVTTADRLRAAGLVWHPAPGDRFVLAGRDMDSDVFVVSDMVADVHHFPSGPVIGFNGTVEWALDSVEAEEALWLPGEDQLRRLLGGTFRSLRVREPGPVGPAEVELQLPGQQGSTVVAAGTVAEAYAEALLRLLALTR